MNFRAFLLLAASVAAVSQASAVELVYNGGFEIQDVNGAYGDGWGINTTIPAYTGDPSYFFDDWTVVGGLPGITAFLGADNDDDVTIFQSIQTDGYLSATLTFDLYSDGWDFPNPSDPFDFLTVSFGGNLLDTIDLGNDGEEFYLSPSYDLTPYLNSGSQLLEIRVFNDSSFNTFSIVDNFSIQAQPVPEPATMAALGLGAIALLRRRRKN